MSEPEKNRYQEWLQFKKALANEKCDACWSEDNVRYGILPIFWLEAPIVSREQFSRYWHLCWTCYMHRSAGILTEPCWNGTLLYHIHMAGTSRIIFVPLLEYVM